MSTASARPGLDHQPPSRGGAPCAGSGETFRARPAHRHRQLHRADRHAARAQRLPAGPEPGLQHRQRQRPVRARLDASACRASARKTSHGVPRYDDARDTFVLSGAEDLVPVRAARRRRRATGRAPKGCSRASSTTATRRQRLLGGPQPRRPGQPSTARPAAPATDRWRRRRRSPHPAEPGHVFAWQLTRDHGPVRQPDRVPVPARPPAGGRTVGPALPRQIRYADYGDGATRFLVTRHVRVRGAAGPVLRPPRRVRDPHHAGAAARIKVRTHADRHRLVRSYTLAYVGRPAATACRCNGVSLLSRSAVDGHDGAATEELPPFEFGYTSFAPERRELRARRPGPTCRRASLADRDSSWSTSSAAALPDILQMNGTARATGATSAAAGSTGRATMREAPAGLRSPTPACS